MATYEEKELKTIGDINATLDKLDVTLTKMDDTDSRVKHFFEQEKALHEIKSVIRKENKLDRQEDKEIKHNGKEAAKWADHQFKLLDEIDGKIDALNASLAKLDDTDSRVKGYFEQQKAIHEIRAILRKAKELEV